MCEGSATQLNPFPGDYLENHIHPFKVYLVMIYEDQLSLYQSVILMAASEAAIFCSKTDE